MNWSQLWQRLNNRRTKISGSIILALLLLAIILLVLPVIGSGVTGEISSGATTRGGGFGIHMGAYQ